jgi:predicted dehydrogenase
MLSVGLVGAGRVGRIRAEILRQTSGVAVVFVADADPARAQEVARLSHAEATMDWRTAVSRHEVEAVIVSTPTKFHAEIVQAALEAGKDVLCEKPLARNLAEAQKMFEAAERAGCVLKTGFNYRHMAHVRKAKELIDFGVLGPLYLLRCRYGHGGRPGYEKDWCTDAELSGGGVLQEQGVHMLDLVRHLLGEPSAVLALTQRFFWNFPAVEDNCFLLLQTPAGQCAQVHVSWTQWRNLLEVELFGRDGYLQLYGRDGHYGPQVLRWGKRQADHSRPQEEVIEFEPPDDSWKNDWEEFAGLVRSRQGLSAAALEGLRTQELVEASYRSARQQGWVEVSSVAPALRESS